MSTSDSSISKLSLLSSTCILVSDIDVVSNFLITILNIPISDIDSNTSSTSTNSPTNANSKQNDKLNNKIKHMKYMSIKINEKDSVVIIEKSSVKDKLLSVVKSISVNQIFVSCKNPGIYITKNIIIIILLLFFISNYSKTCYRYRCLC